MSLNSATSTKKKFNQTRWKRDRSYLLSERDARAMERLLTSKHVKPPKQAAVAIEKLVSEWTSQRALRRIGLISTEKQKKPLLSETNVNDRLKLCKEYKNWSVDDWKRVIMSDETKINHFQSDDKECYRYRP